jgi:hypothetical protein
MIGGAHRFLCSVSAMALCLAGTWSTAHAQSEQLRLQCQAASRPAVQQFCENVADATVILQPRVGIGLSGGNPVPGTPSTMGKRLGTVPRLSLGLRVTAAAVPLPPIDRLSDTASVTFPVGSINIDGSIGLFQGIALLPTVGGFGSLDLIGSVGIMPLPRGEGFDDSAPVSWMAGARIGLLRESFTAPGVSIDLMHRRMGTVAYGTAELVEEDAFLELDRFRATSVRGTVGKRLLGYGVSGGVAWDRYTADVHARIRDATVLNPTNVLVLEQSSLTTSRMSIYGNASLTILILNLATEFGWQRGGSPIEGASDRLGKGGLFGGVAVRLAI